MIPIDELMNGLLPSSDALGIEGDGDHTGRHGLRISATRIELTLPVGVAYERGGDVLAMPPTVAMSTGFDPIFQRLRILLEREE